MNWKLNTFLLVLLLSTHTAFTVNAPVTTIATVTTAVVNQQVTVPVTVTGFSNIAGLYLAIDYEYAKLHYVSGTIILHLPDSAVLEILMSAMESIVLQSVGQVGIR